MMKRIFNYNKSIFALVLIFISLCGFGQGQNQNNFSLNFANNGNDTYPNNTAFQIAVGITSNGCPTQTVTLNVGALIRDINLDQYPTNAVSTSFITNSSTGNVLTINIDNSLIEGNSSRLFFIGLKFPQYFCNQNVTINGSLSGCGVLTTKSLIAKCVTNHHGSINIVQKSPSVQYCLNQTIKYTITASNFDSYTNSNGSGLPISNAKYRLEVPSCANIQLYKGDTYSSLTYATLTASNPNRKLLEWTNNPYIGIVNTSYTFDVYVTFPCSSGCNGNNTQLTPTLLGTVCSNPITVNGNSANASINANCTTYCGGSGGNPVGELGVSTSGYARCIGSCLSSSRAQFDVNTPYSAITVYPRKFIVNIPSGLRVTSAYTSGSPCSATMTFFDQSGAPLAGNPSNSLLSKIEWVFPASCNSTAPTISFVINYNYDSTFPATSTTVNFSYKLETTDPTKNQPPTGFLSYSQTIDSCISYMYGIKQVKRKDVDSASYSVSAAGLPNEEFTYRITLRNNSDSVYQNVNIEDFLDPRQIYTGNFRYYYGPYTASPTSVNLPDSNSTFSEPNLGTIQVVRPDVGSSGGLIKLSGFNLPCGTNYLTIEFDVKLKNNLIANTIIPNQLVVNSQNLYYQTQIKITPSESVSNTMLVRCPTTGYWSRSPLSVKNGDELSFKMRLVNDGSKPVVLSNLVNQKPQLGDLFETNFSNRGSQFRIDYSCSSPQVFTNAASLPTVVYKYSDSPVTMSRTMICPPVTGSVAPLWTTSCSQNTNWFMAEFPQNATLNTSNFILNPGDYIEIEYKGVVNGASGTTGVAYNTSTFKITGCSLPSGVDLVNKLTLNNNGVGCVSIAPCADFLWDVDGSFESCSNIAGHTFNQSVNCGGWSNLSSTPDTWKLPITFLPSNPINTNIPASENGGVFAGAIAKRFGSSGVESFKTEIHNLVIGASYRIEFEQINMTYAAYANNNVNWEVEFGGIKSYSTPLATSSNPKWKKESIDFIATSTDQTLIFKGHSSLITPPNLNNPFVSEFSYVGIDGIKVISNTTCPPPCYDCTSFDLLTDEKYLVSGWVKEEDPGLPNKQYKTFDKSYISIAFTDRNHVTIGTPDKFYATGEIIDGWQRIVGEFMVPTNVDDMTIELVNESNNGKMVYFDDIRVLPSKGNMKSFVYDQKTQRLMAELDENNYSTFYEYDLEGGLIRIKKETEKGVFTIQETRSGNTKKE